MLDTFIGSIAATLTTVCFIPQALSVIRTKDTRSLSLWMYSLFTAGVSFWLLYGILLSNMPIIIANIVTLALSIIILSYKIQEKRLSKSL